MSTMAPQQALSQMWRNAFGTEPDMPTVNALASQVQHGDITLAAIAMIAADLPSNTARIDLTGLATAGWDYIPVGG